MRNLRDWLWNHFSVEAVSSFFNTSRTSCELPCFKIFLELTNYMILTKLGFQTIRGCCMTSHRYWLPIELYEIQCTIGKLNGVIYRQSHILFSFDQSELDSYLLLLQITRLQVDCSRVICSNGKSLMQMVSCNVAFIFEQFHMF